MLPTPSRPPTSVPDPQTPSAERRSHWGRSRPSDASTRLGRWQLVERIYEGPWSCVFRARPLELDEQGPADYAIKVAADTSEAIGMLQREARLGRMVNSVHLAPILASHTDNPPFYLVMPFLEGSSLAQLSRQPLPVPHALWFARQTATALAALHGHGWRHGDVKPENVRVSTARHVTLLDLGFACRFEDQAVNRTSFSGSLRYAAPELVCGTIVAGERADVYSLGATLFELLAGRPPFPGDQPEAVARAVLQDRAPPLRRLMPQVPAAVSHLVQRMLAKQPLRRPSTDELLAALVKLEVEYFDEWQAAFDEPYVLQRPPRAAG